MLLLFRQKKSANRRQKDITKRFGRKISSLETAAKNLDVILKEISENRNWLKEKLAIIQKPPLLGFEVSNVDKHVQFLKVLLFPVLTR